MGTINAVLCSSHSPALMLPYERWDTVYQYIDSNRQSPLPDEVQRELAAETPVLAAEKHAACMQAIAELREHLRLARPDLVVMFGDDQEENFPRTAMPPFAAFIGDETFGYPFKLLDNYFGESPGEPVTVRGSSDVARRLVSATSEAGFDVAYSESLPDTRWGLPHSIIRLVHLLGIQVPVLPIFINALYEPAATPRRCYGLGQAVGEFLESETDRDLRITVIGSGGLSHTPRGPLAGYINAEHDRWVIEQLRAGQGEALGKLTTDELWQGANHELREWLPAIAMVAQHRPDFLQHILSYRMIAGYGFGAWHLN
ncbi:MAG: hypothetical protein JO352_38240 [Chloroflexi bacterium]|nr:hypothetical protein [Chloroflexota bacterium]MBV9603372.1 hypothetical protein [Chloroflexota bacterium]